MIKLNITIIVKLKASKKNEKKNRFKYHNLDHFKVIIILKSRHVKDEMTSMRLKTLQWSKDSGQGGRLMINCLLIPFVGRCKMESDRVETTI